MSRMRATAAVAVSSLCVTAACGSTGGRAVAHHNHAAPRPFHILVPSFIYPGSGWDGIASSYPTVGIALVNIDSGPGTGPESNFQDQVSAEQAAGVQMYGYVSAAYGDEALSDAETQIDDYASWYGVNDIFVDEASTNCNLVSSYFQPLYAYIHAHGGQEILNPGTSTSACYMAATDILDTFEGSYSQYLTYSAPAWTTGYPATRFFNEIFDTATQSNMVNAVSQSLAQNVGWIYVTDAGLPNPYDTLPSYWSDEVSVVSDSAHGAAH